MSSPRLPLAALLLSASFIAPTASAQSPAPQPQNSPKPDPKAASRDDTRVGQFETLTRKVRQDSTATEADVQRVISLGLELDRPVAANLAVRAYLARNANAAPALVRQAADLAHAAGDFQSAATRYKAVLREATPSKENSETFARLMQILVDHMGNTDDALETSARLAERFRTGSPAALRFDGWYINEARRRQNAPAVADRLALVLADKMPLEQERYLYWDDLDWLLTMAARIHPRQFPAAASLSKIAPLIREDEIRSKRAAFLAENLKFKTSTAGLPPAEFETRIAPTLAAAEQFFAISPTSATLREIVTVLSANADGNAWHEEWLRSASSKQKFLAAQFLKLPEAERAAALSWAAPWSNFLFTPRQWTDLAIQTPQTFAASDWTSLIPFVEIKQDAALIPQQAKFLAGKPSSSAAVVAALNGGSLTEGGFRELFTQNNWYSPRFNEAYLVFHDTAWPIFVASRTAEENKTNDLTYARILLKHGPELLAGSPIVLFDIGVAQRYLAAAWNHSGNSPLDRFLFVEHARNLEWVPWTNQQRREAFNGLAEQIRQWCDAVRRDLDTARKELEGTNRALATAKTALEKATADRAAAAPDKTAAADQALAAAQKAAGDLEKRATTQQARVADLERAAGMIPAIEPQMKRLLDETTADINKCKDPLAKALAQCVVAQRQKNRDAFQRAGREAYALVREYRTRKTPYATATLHYLLANRPDVDPFDMQLDILADQLTLIDPMARNADLEAMIVRFAQDRPNWNGLSINVPEAARARRVHAMFAKAVTDMAAKNQASIHVLNWFRQTRSGPGWSENKIGQDAMAAIIEKRLWNIADPQNNNIRPMVPSLMATVANEYKDLAQKFPLQGGFDAMYIEEAQRLRYFDPAYWNWGTDPNKRVAGAAVQLFSTFDKLPLGYGSAPTLWNRQSLSGWYSRLFQLPKADRDPLIAKVEGGYGKTRFDEWADGRLYFILNEFDLGKPADRKVFFERLNALLDRLESSPARTWPLTVHRISGLDPASLSDSELATLNRLATSNLFANWSNDYGYEAFAMMLLRANTLKNNPRDLVKLAPWLWRVTRDTRSGNLQRTLARVAREASDKGQSDLAALLSSVGLDLMGPDIADETRSALLAVRSRSMVAVGGAVAVPRTDPRYPVLSAQAEFLGGEVDSAWESYQPHAARAATMVRDLDASFIIWAIGRHVDTRGYDAAEALSRALLTWIESAPTGFEPEIRAGAQVAYAGLSLAKQDFPRARAQYERIVATPEFEATQARTMAEIRIAEIDRLTRQYDRATERLTRLMKRRDRLAQTEALYQMALVRFDQEQWSAAQEQLDQLFAIDSGNARGRILEGRLQLKMNKLIEATEVKVGLSAEQATITPGRVLKIDLEDRNLALVGAGADLQVRVWTDNGDEERLTLLPFGDSRTRFSGRIPTTLGTPVKGDGVLQVLGNSTVRYELIRADGKTAKSAAENTPTMTVVTDGELYASSGRILSKQEQEERDLERRIRQQLQARGESTGDEGTALAEERAANEVKPGNPIYVRVIDADRSGTPNSRVTVRASTSNGDVIEAFQLTETPAFSGIFEGQIPTGGGQAIANASDTEESSHSNFPISPANHPAWIGQPDSRKPKAWWVDLNDNVPVDRMSILADVAGRKLRDFAVQISLNGKQFTTVATWPTATPMWDGSPMIDVVRWNSPIGAPRKVEEFESYFESQYIAQSARRLSVPMDRNRIAGSMQTLAGLAERVATPQGRPFAVRIRAAFHMPARGVKTFQVNTFDRPQAANYLLAINGEVGDEPLRISRSLGQGVHRLDLYVLANVGSNFQFALTTDTPQNPQLLECPPDMFDVAKEPKIKEAIAVPSATISANPDAGQFDVQFAEGHNARLVRLLINDFENDAPAIRKVSLTRRGEAENSPKRTLLPTPKDFLELRRNNVLEIVPGDKVTIQYLDEVNSARNRRTMETALSATFSDAVISACFAEYREVGDGQRTSIFVPMRRFKVGEPIDVVIKDPDMDRSNDRDTMKFEARTLTGTPIVINALETEKHSGTFLGKVFPISGKPTRPGELQVGPNDEIELSYFDTDNTNPGIPWKRTVRVEQAIYSEPQVRVFDVTSEELNADQRKAAAAAAIGRLGTERLEITRSLTATRPNDALASDAAATVPIEGPLVVELTAPWMVVSPRSKATIYAQTSTARSRARSTATDTFDVNVPGTIKLEVMPSLGLDNTPPAGFATIRYVGHASSAIAMDEGRFTVRVPIALGPVPDDTLINETVTPTSRPTLAVKGDDVIFLGVPVQGPDGQTRWIERQVKLRSEVFFDVMDRRYRQSLTAVHAGDLLNLRIIDRAKDTSDDKDTVAVQVKTASGQNATLEVGETLGHSGMFQSSVQLVRSAEKSQGAATQPSSSVATSNALNVSHGDTIQLSYQASDGSTVKRTIEVYKGADGLVSPFTKRFSDVDMAVQTQFTVAEASFELAKKYRESGQEEMARKQIAMGKQTLEEAIRDFPQSQFRAQADYLLANLAIELAKETADPKAKRQQQADAIGRLSQIVANYPDSQFAPKSQFKKALVLEQMGEMDAAMEEYVKLSYRYPDNELVAETIGRLGQYFMIRGRDLEEKSNAMNEGVEKVKTRLASREQFKIAAEVFGRLGERFPSHSLAGRTQVLSGQCYIRADMHDRAVEVFRRIVDEGKVDKDLMATSMYWAGECYMKLNDMTEAYRMFKRLTLDYPESQMARHARSKLSEEALNRVEEAEKSR